MRKAIAMIGLILLSGGSMSLAGTKEEVIRLQKDVLQLQQLVRLMQESQDQQNGVLKSLLEQLNDQIAQMKADNGALVDTLRSRTTGQEQLSSELRDAFAKMTVQLDETNSRVAALRQQVEDSQMNSASVRNYTADVQGAVEPDRVYIAAYNDYLVGNFELAIAAFMDFLATFPDSEYSDNAAYYLGVCQMEQGRYEAAIKAFDEVLNLFPKADKMTPAYYKKGLALLQVQRNAEAIETFKKLLTRFPESSEALLSKDELQKLGIDPEELVNTDSGR